MEPPEPNSAIAELSRIVGGLAHEIKNPLSTINLNLKLLGEDLGRYRDDDHQRFARRLQLVQAEADRLRQILDDFLQYAGRHELTLVEVDLRDLVGELRDFFLPQAEASRVVLRTSLGNEPILCRLDVNLMKQALLNLMINATQAMTDGGELLLHVGRRGENALIDVIDTGPGIPAENLHNIFRAYWSTKSGGSGLGLPTARRIVREHGGTMSVESEPGKGTRFLITLPLAKRPE
ncbi:MAG: two-component sensor histidine kinase [Phycisphaerae bacterium]|nr:two-component sensor histidine kinase [Phycisphaerae bacterium]